MNIYKSHQIPSSIDLPSSPFGWLVTHAILEIQKKKSAYQS